jgi:hypothetical protein
VQDRRRHEFAQILGLKIRVAFEFVPGLMQRELRDFMNLVATLEQAAGRLMPQVMKAQVVNSQNPAGSRERGADALRVVGKNVFARPGLRGDEPQASGVYLNRR